MTSLLRGAAANLVTIGVGVLSGLLVTVATTRAWEPSRYGDYAYRSWLGSTLGLLAASAFPALAVRLVAEALGAGESGRARRVAWRSVGGVAASLALLLLGFVALAPLLDRVAPGQGRAPVLALAAGQALASVAALALQGAGRFDLVAAGSLLAAGGSAVAAAALASAGHGPDAVLWTLALGQGLFAALLLLALARVLPRGADTGGPPARSLAAYFFPVAALVVIDLVVWQRSELLFLGHFSGAEDIALYAAAFAVAGAIARSAPMALGGVLTPAFAGFAGRARRDQAAPFFARAVAAMAAVSLTLALVGFALGPTLFGLLRAEYLAALPLLPVLLVGLVTGNVSGTASTVFHGFGRADALLRMGVVLATANLALDLLLIPRWGALGAAFACGAAQTLSLPLAAVLLGRATGFRFPWLALARLAAATLVGAAAVLLSRALLPAATSTDLGSAAVALALALAVWIGLGGPADLRPRALVTDPAPPPPTAPKLSVIVPTKNRPDYLSRCLRQVLEQPGPSRELIVIDSSDDDRTQGLLAAEFPELRRVRVEGMPHNRHFAKNQGIRLARGEILLFLDDDSLVEPGWLERMVRLYDDPEVGGAGGRIIDEVFGAAPTGEVVGGIEPNGRIHLNFTRDTGAIVDVDHVIGCNMSFRRDALARAGGFDLAYGGPNLMEETDLCLRVRRAGYRIRFDPAAVVYHANAPRDAGFRRKMLDTRLEFWSARSRAYFAWKLLPRSLAVLRHNALGALKQHLELAWHKRSALHLRAFALQAAGLVLGSLDWLLWRCPRVPPGPDLRARGGA